MWAKQGSGLLPPSPHPSTSAFLLPLTCRRSGEDEQNSGAGPASGWVLRHKRLQLPPCLKCQHYHQFLR